MKPKFLLTLALLLLCEFAVAQRSFTRIGYSFGNAPLPVTNSLIRDWNQSQFVLRNPMEEVHQMSGFTFSKGVRTGRLYGELGITLKSDKTRGVAEDATGQRSVTRVRVREHAVTAGAGYRLVNGWVNVTLGGTVDAGMFQVAQKHSDEVTAFSRPAQTTLLLSSHVFADFGLGRRSGIYVRPYVQIPWTSVNLREAAENITPGSTAEKPVDSFEEIPMNWGVNVSLMIAKKRKDR